MRSVIVLTAVLFVGASTGAGAQAARPATTPEVFSATAQAKTASSAVSGALVLRVSRYTPDFDRKTVEEALRLGGYPRFLTALRNAPEVGQLTLADGPPYVIRYAREKAQGAGREIVLVTDRPVFFVGSARTDAKPRAGYEVAVIQIQVDGAGRGKGTMAAAARVRPDGSGGVLLDDYADALIEVTSVTRRPGDQ
ncbi:MAG TPA: hypothetical protein VIY56_10385 [Vicinamibacterales bacterium]